MATSSDTIYDMFMQLISDWRLDTLFVSSGSAALCTYLEAWLLFSISEFENICDQSLTYNSGSQVFIETLTQENINMLANIMTRWWLTKTVNDILQMNLSIVDHDFKTFSQSQNLKEKREYLNSKKEEISQLLNDYSYRKNSWSDWKLQVFD